MTETDFYIKTYHSKGAWTKDGLDLRIKDIGERDLLILMRRIIEELIDRDLIALSTAYES